MVRCLGKRPARHDPHALQLATYLRAGALPAIPPACDWTGAVTSWGIDENDSVGDCTIAAADHLIRLWSANNGPMQSCTDQAIIAAYSAVSGYDPTTGANDNGAVELDVLNLWKGPGIGGFTIDAWADPSPQDIAHIEASVFLFGGCYLGVGLPLRAQQQLDAGLPWDVGHSGFFGRVRGIDQPNSWGGHAIPIVGYDRTNQMFKCITWGQPQLLTYRWFQTYCDEAHTPASKLWIGGKGISPSLIDLPTLLADQAAIAA